MNSSIRNVLLAALFVICAAPPLRAQDTLSVAARLVMRQPPGIVLRVNAGNEQITGVLERVDAGRVHLASPERVVPLSTVTDAWLQRRSTGRGGRAGAIIGATGGATVFGLGAALLSGLCGYDCDWGTGEIALAALLGGALGAGSGYLVGALIGSSVPRWEPLTESSAPATVRTGNPRRHAGLSAMSVTPLAAHAASGDGMGAGVSFAYMSQLSNHIAVGPELGFYDLNLPPLEYSVPCGGPNDELCFNTQEPGRNWSAGGVARLGPGADRRLEPYALVGLGVYRFGYGTNLGGYSAGAGVRYRPGTGRFAVSGESRWHSNFTNSGDDVQLGFYTVGLSLSLLR